ncbi:MAG: c-type cytochrome [Chloroflexi bacterium]|nr:c-type cytochrome [Chloroflexota bacterium]
MNDEEKKAYLEKYHEEKKKGVPFFPDIIFKDAVVSLVLFLILVALAYFIGAPLENRANPADTTYTPRPEWYFLFLFQLLKYFPGNLEVIGVVLIPTLAILILFLLPFIDRSRFRDFRSRPIVISGTLVVLAGILFLTIQSVREAPPPAEAKSGDQTAAIYTANCAPCHGESIVVPAGINLHDVIAKGKHEGMPAWGADLSTDQIDALAGFILSPGGSQLFTQYCGECHKVEELVSSNPIELKKALELGLSYPPHANLNMPNLSTAMDQNQRSRLLNFLVAPDGERLFATNCSPCHGSSVAFNGTKDELRKLISTGGQHLVMPAWKEKLSSTEIDLLAKYVVDPKANPDGEQAFDQYCKSCHGDRVPKADTVEQAQQIISTGGSHQTMPVWGSILTPEQLDALVEYTYQASQGTSLGAGQQLFEANCVPCHGQFGEGGPNPAKPGSFIVPITTSEFLKTRDDATLRAIISLGQPSSGMSPFSSSNGGSLDDTQIDAIVAYLRSWEKKPLETLPEAAAPTPTPIPTESLPSGEKIYVALCVQCHGSNGKGGAGPALNAADFQQDTDQEIFNAISKGVPNTAMAAWGEVLNSDQINQLVKFIRTFGSGGASTGTTTPTPSATPSFTADVLPILKNKCSACHGSSGGWDASSYKSVMESGANAPVVVPGNAANSLLVQKIMGTQKDGMLMPPGGKLSEAEIQIITNWINAGALEK